MPGPQTRAAIWESEAPEASDPESRPSTLQGQRGLWIPGLGLLHTVLTENHNQSREHREVDASPAGPLGGLREGGGERGTGLSIPKEPGLGAGAGTEGTHVGDA